MPKRTYARNLAAAVAIARSFCMPLQAAGLQCDHDRYYEGDDVTCDIPQDPGVGQDVNDVTVRWSILGKDLEKRNVHIPWPVKTKPGFGIQAPVGLRSVVPLELEATYRRLPHPAAAAIFRTTVQVFPRNPAFWIGQDEFKGKAILVDPSAAWARPHLDALHIPYVMNNGGELMALKRVDATLSDKTLKAVNPADPWARWQLVQCLRTQINAAARTSNP